SQNAGSTTARTPAFDIASRSSVVRLVMWMCGSKKCMPHTLADGLEIRERLRADAARERFVHRRAHERIAFELAALFQCVEFTGAGEPDRGRAPADRSAAVHFALEGAAAALAGELPE